MARKRDRIIASTAALLFLVTSVGFSVMVIWQMQQDSKKSKENAAIQDALQDAQAQQETDTCGQTPVEGPNLSTPEIFKPGADVTELQTTDLTAGTGAAIAAGSCVSMKYYGTLAVEGTRFDDNFSSTATYTFRVGTGSVIAGWDEGLIGMKEGGTRRLVIPSDKAYGETGSPPSIGANADLVFLVQAVKVGQ